MGGQFSAQGVHKQFGISLVTPAFPHPLAPRVTRHKVRLELVRPSDEACSEPVDFYFTAASAPRPAVTRAADKENNISDNPEDNPNIKLELAPMMPRDYQDLLCNNPMDLRDSGNIGDSLTAFEHQLNNLSGKISESLSISLSDVIDNSMDHQRSSVGATLETGRGQMSLHTPDHSESLLSEHQVQMTRLLTNCP